MLVDVKTAAELLGGLGYTTVLQMIREGKLPSVHVGRRVLIPRQALQDFIEERAQAATLRTQPAR